MTQIVLHPVKDFCYNSLNGILLRTLQYSRLSSAPSSHTHDIKILDNAII